MAEKYIRIVLLLVFVAVFCISSYMAIGEITVAKNEESAFSDIADSVFENRAVMRRVDAEMTSPEGSGEVSSDDEPEAPQAAWYEGLLKQNSELFGWIEIPGTNVNYPVMHTPDDPEKYLHTAFDGSYSKSGVPFLDGDCYNGCGNYIVYGHNMKNGSMFHDLLSYSKEDYFVSHQNIYFDTLDCSGDYEIIAVFRSKVFRADETGVFRYYIFTDLTDESVFNEYIAGITAASLYDTGKTAEFGDSLLTLSTCGKNNDDERFVVVAKKVE